MSKPRCRTIEGVVYELKPTDRKPPCPRGRPPATAARPSSATAAKPAAAPAAPRLRAPERDLIRGVARRNAAGLYYHAGHHAPNVRAMLDSLVGRGLVLRHSPHLFLVPEYSGQPLTTAEAWQAAPAAPVSAPAPAPARDKPRKLDRYGKPRKLPLPARLDPAAAAVGQRVSVARAGVAISSFDTTEFDHGELAELPSRGGVGRDSTEPTVRYVGPGNALPDGFRRHVPWERIYPGWVEPRTGYAKWRP